MPNNSANRLLGFLDSDTIRAGLQKGGYKKRGASEVLPLRK